MPKGRTTAAAARSTPSTSADDPRSHVSLADGSRGSALPFRDLLLVYDASIRWTTWHRNGSAHLRQCLWQESASLGPCLPVGTKGGLCSNQPESRPTAPTKLLGRAGLRRVLKLRTPTSTATCPFSRSYLSALLRMPRRQIGRTSTPCPLLTFLHQLWRRSIRIACTARASSSKPWINLTGRLRP